MADWGQPTLPDAYPDFMDRLKGRDLDAGTLFLVDPTNPPVGLIRFNRSLNLFQEWNGSTWVNKVIAQAGGGTGAGSLPALGTMASQNANNVAITGGNMTGMSSVYANGELRSATHLRINGQLVVGSSQIVLTDVNGKIPNISTNYIADMNGVNLTNMNASQLSHGTVYRDRLGSGAVGSGNRVLVDNGTWVDKFQVGAGMVEIVHNDSSFGSGEIVKTVNISWTVMPSSTKKISVQVNSALANVSWRVTAVNQFEIRLNSESPGTIVPWTAFHHITQV